MYLGLDCSSKAVHGIVIDEEENIVLQFKSYGNGSDFDSRFSEIFVNFSVDLTHISGNRKNNLSLVKVLLAW